MFRNRLFCTWENFTRATTTHVCSMLLLMQNINPLTGVNVVQLESWLLLHRHFFWDEAPKSGKDGVERLFCPWLEIEMSPFGKIVFFLGTFHRLFLFCKIKRNRFWKDVRLDKCCRRNRNAQRSKNLQSFWFWVKENFLYTLKWIRTWWEFQKNIFLSVEDLVCWCYPDILSLLFQYTSRKAIAPKNRAVNHIHILALSLIRSDIFIF